MVATAVTSSLGWIRASSSSPIWKRSQGRIQERETSRIQCQCPCLLRSIPRLGSSSSSSSSNPLFSSSLPIPSFHIRRRPPLLACLPSSYSPNTNSNVPPKLYVSGLSFRTTEDGLRNVFQKFGQLVEVKLIMDRIANRSRGFAFLRYATEEESKAAIEGMHGKFLDGRVIFVEVAKPRADRRQGLEQDGKPC